MTRQYLVDKLTYLKQQFQMYRSNLDAANGAVLLAEHLLAEWDRLEAEAKAEAIKLEDKAKEALEKLEN